MHADECILCACMYTYIVCVICACIYACICYMHAYVLRVVYMCRYMHYMYVCICVYMSINICCMHAYVCILFVYMSIHCQHPLDHRKSKRVPEIHVFCFIDYAKIFDCVDHNNLWKILQEMGIPDHLTCLLRNLYAGQEATDRMRHGTMDWFQVGKGVRQGCILSPCLFNLYAEYIM